MPTTNKKNNKKKKSKGNNKNIGNPSNNREHGNNNTGNSAAVGGYYEIYKIATANFWEWVNKTTDKPVRTIGDLQQGATAIHDAVLRAVNNDEGCSVGDPILHKLIPPVQVMRNLTKSIKYRKMVMDEKFGGGDDGHRFMVQALCYCRSVLRGARHMGRQWIIRQQQRQQQQSSTNGDNGVEDDTFLGRFQTLALDDDDDDDDDDDGQQEEAEGHDEPVTPVTEASANNRDIQEALIDGDLCFQSAMLLVTMNGLMRFIDQQYVGVKQALRDMNQDQEEQKSHVKIIRLIMQASSVVNMATQTIRAAENALMACYPHISSFYHILAILFCRVFVDQVHAMIPSDKSQQNPNLALDFVADMVFEYFGFFEETQDKTKRFAKKNKVPLDSLEHVVEQVKNWAWMEIVHNNGPMNYELWQIMGIEGHEWLARFQYIGGDRCILNTLQWIQKMTAREFNLPPERWTNEPTGLRMRDDLDGVFTTTVFRKLWCTCSNAPFDELVVENELLTVLNMIHLHKHAKSCFRSSVTSPVSVAMTFAVHAVLTAMFVVQGDGDLQRVAIITKLAFDNFFAKLGELENGTGNHPYFYNNLKILQRVIPFTHTIPKPDPRGDLIAFWNPCVAGGYLLYVTYRTSLELGMSTLNEMGELKITLHLYHALKKLLESFRVPFLEEVNNIFKSAKAVWPAGQPERGSFAKHFELARDGKSPLPHPREYSASYRTIVMQSFDDKRSDLGGKLTQDYFDVFSRAAMIHESVQADGHVMLSMNYASLGSLLLEFVNKLSETMGWEKQIQNATSSFSSTRFSEIDLRRASLGLFVGDMLRRMDGIQHSRQTLVIRDSRPVLVEEKEAEPIASPRIGRVMVEFFENVPPQQCRFYT